MVGPCFLGESSGDEFSRVGEPDQRRQIMRDIIWFSLVNGNPGCFFWNARGFEVEQFRLAHELTRDIDWSTWQRARPEVGLIVAHPIDDDKYYRTEAGRADYAMMARYSDHFLRRGIDFDFTMDGEGYRHTADRRRGFIPDLPAAEPLIGVPDGWQAALCPRHDYREGFCYVRNIAGIDEWTVRDDRKMYMRRREPAPLTLRLQLPLDRVAVEVTDLDTGVSQAHDLRPAEELSLGTTDHDFVVKWQAK
jgi:hypothetical protein